MYVYSVISIHIVFELESEWNESLDKSEVKILSLR